MNTGEFGDNGAFVKLDGIATSDAKWMNHDLCCHTADDVFYILKASKRVGMHLKNFKPKEQAAEGTNAEDNCQT